MDSRFIHCPLVISFPTGYEEEDKRLKKGCCRKELKLADVADPINWKNDWSGVPVKAFDPTDIVDFVIEKCGEANPLPNLGEVGVFPNDQNLRGFMYDWRQYLDIYGAGTYTIKVQFTISGTPGGYTWGVFELKPYSIPNAEATVRTFIKYNSFNLRENMDFTNSNFKDSLRFEGFFGDRQPQMQVNNLYTKGRKLQKVTRENLNEFTLYTSPVNINITRVLLDWHLLNEDVLLITDHNRYNHNYNIFDKPVTVPESPTMEYYTGNRWAKMDAKFIEREAIDKTYYNVK
jgi:hypothetical protein